MEQEGRVKWLEAEKLLSELEPNWHEQTMRSEVEWDAWNAEINRMVHDYETEEDYLADMG